MRKLFAAALLAAAFTLVTAAPAFADTDSIVNIGNDTLGYSVGTTGGSTSVGGYTTTVDGIGTFNGSTSIVGPGLDARIDQGYSLDGLHTTGHINGYGGDGAIELYGDGVEAEGTFYSPNGSVELVCDITGCREE